MRVIIVVLICIAICIMPAFADAYVENALDHNVGVFIKSFKALPDGSNIDIYKRSWTETRPTEQVYDPKWAGEWHYDLYSLMRKKKNLDTSELIFQIRTSYPTDKQVVFPRVISIDFLDIKLTGNSGTILCAKNEWSTFVYGAEFSWSQDTVKFISTNYVGTFDVTDSVKFGEILPDNTYQLTFKNRIEKWKVVETNDKNSYWGKKPELISRSKIADDANSEKDKNGDK